MTHQAKLKVEHQRLDGSIGKKVIFFQIMDNGIYISATDTITFKSALLLARKLKDIVDDHVKEIIQNENDLHP